MTKDQIQTMVEIVSALCPVQQPSAEFIQGLGTRTEPSGLAVLASQPVPSEETQTNLALVQALCPAPKLSPGLAGLFETKR